VAVRLLLDNILMAKGLRTCLQSDFTGGKFVVEIEQRLCSSHTSLGLSRSHTQHIVVNCEK
jgi:hypothetical protein